MELRFCKRRKKGNKKSLVDCEKSEVEKFLSQRKLIAKLTQHSLFRWQR